MYAFDEVRDDLLGGFVGHTVRLVGGYMWEWQWTIQYSRELKRVIMKVRFFELNCVI